MVVYVVMREVHYEGSSLEAVFSTKDVADKYIKDIIKKFGKPCRDTSYEVYEMLVDDEANTNMR